MRSLRPLLSKRCNEDGGEGEKDHPAKNVQGIDGTVDERKRTYVAEGVMEYCNHGRTGQNLKNRSSEGGRVE